MPDMLSFFGDAGEVVGVARLVTSAVNGLIGGAIIGLVAVGLVLVYKGARVFNFAQAEFGTVAAFTVWGLHTGGGGLPLGWALVWAIPAAALLFWVLLDATSPRTAGMVGLAAGALLMWLLLSGPQPLGIAIPAGLAAGTAFGLILQRLVVRPLADQPRVILLVATAGVAIAVISIQLFLGEAQARVLDPIYQLRDAAGQPGFLFVAGVAVTAQQMVILGVLVAVAALLWWFFSRTNLGLAVLGTSQDSLATRLSGISVNRISAFVWGFAALLGALAGVLQGAVTIFTPGFMTRSILLPALTGAVLGGMTSLPGAFIGGLLVGVARDVGAELIPASITGGAELTVFALLLLVLLVRPQGLLGREA